ncbi:hypothetical protein LXJ15735_05340 [Lacrimispora xylanolytica]
MDRKENLLNAINKLIPEQFIKSSKLIASYCEENSREMVHEFLKAFMNSKEQAMICQDNGGKGKLSYILFSNLYSSIFLKNYLIRIDMMDSSFYSDTAFSTSYWDAQNIYYLFEEDVKAISKQIETYFPRIREYEVDYIRYAYLPYYHRIAKAFIQSMLTEAIKEERFLPCNDRLDNQVHILFGEYMGQADILYILGKEL